MTVYRITLAVHADKLVASGYPARWNSKDIKVIYTAQSRALACLENVVHRNSRGLQDNFRILTINIPDQLKVMVIDRNTLVADWQQFASLPYTQRIGDKWVKDGMSAVLQVPSVIIPGEFNYILNVAHKDFTKITLVGNEPFSFDGRIKG
jgi:RES domain-containing protein